MSNFVGIDIEGLPTLLERLGRVGKGEAWKEGTQAVAKFLRTTMQKYPSPRYVSRKQAYGVTFFSDKQRRYFFAALKSGAISVPYTRTRELMQSWKIEPWGKWDYIVVNGSMHAVYTQDDDNRSRMAKMIGWKTVSEIVERYSDKIGRIMAETVRNAIRKIGLTVR